MRYNKVGRYGRQRHLVKPNENGENCEIKLEEKENEKN